MNTPLKTTLGAATLAVAIAASSTAFAAGSINGIWLRDNGTKIKYTGNGTHCGKVLNGKYKGQSIGCMRGKNGSYKGKVIVLDEGKTYTGKAKVVGNILKLSGCVSIFCKTANLKRVK